MSNLLYFSGVPAIDAAACDIAACMIRLGYPILESRSGDARNSCTVNIPPRSVWFRVANFANSDVVISLCPETGKVLFTSSVAGGDEFSDTHLSKFMREFNHRLEREEDHAKRRSARTAVALPTKASIKSPTKAAAQASTALASTASETGPHSRLFSEELFQVKHLQNRPPESGPLQPAFFFPNGKAPRTT
jgi:hypothetical protein